MNNKHNHKIAECFGLWLAEGDNKSKNEITFTNNCWELVNLFHQTLISLFKEYNPKIRIYVYSPNNKLVNVPLNNVQVNYYKDMRATKPYYIWRLASVKIVKKWKNIVEEIQNYEYLYADILRGFFAGEGSIKESSHSSRVIKISQAKRLEIIEKIMNYLKIEYRFSYYHRDGYVIQRKENFDRLAKISIADLHPVKKDKFNIMLSNYKENHYKTNYIKNKLIGIFNSDKLYNAQQLAKIFNRSIDRISEILVELKKDKIAKNFRVRSKDYWIGENQNVVIISSIKYKYLNILKSDAKRTKDISEKAGVCSKAAFNRLNELQKLGLVRRRDDKMWELISTDKEVIVV